MTGIYNRSHILFGLYFFTLSFLVSTICSQNEENKAKRVQHLLKELKQVNGLIVLRPSDSNAAGIKKEVCLELIKVACALGEFQLAQYGLFELETLKNSTDFEKNELYSFLKQKKQNSKKKFKYPQRKLKKHLARLEYWIEALQNPKKGMRESALIEICKMPEEEVFQRLLQILEEGTNYYLANNQRFVSKSEFYNVMVTAIGWLEKPQAARPLLNSLKKMEKKISKAPTHQRAIDDIQFMVNLTNALAFSKAVKATNTIQEIRYKMGEYSLYSQQTRLALDKLLNLPSKNNPTFQNQPHQKETNFNKRGILKLEKGEFKEAIENFTHSIQLNPQNATSYNNRGIAFKNLKQLEKAILDFNRAIQLNPQNANFYFNRGLTHSEMDNHNASLKDFKLSLELDPNNANCHLNYGIALSKLQRISEAQLEIDKAIKLNPKEGEYYLHRGKIRVSLKQFHRALNDYDQAIKLKPNLAIVYNERATLKSQLGDYRGGIADCDQAIRLAPQNDQFYANRGVLFYSSKQNQRALQDFNEAIRLNPNNFMVYANRGNLLIKFYRLDEAIRDFQIALKFNPRFKGIYNQLGYSLSKTGKNVEALNCFDQAIKLFPEEPEFYFQRGFVLVMLGRMEEAKKDFERYLKISTNRNPTFQGRKRFIIQQFPELK